MEEVKTYPQTEVKVGEVCPHCHRITTGDHKCGAQIVHEIIIEDSVGITEKL